jgi:hypothetical protein
LALEPGVCSIELFILAIEFIKLLATGNSSKRVGFSFAGNMYVTLFGVVLAAIATAALV